MSALKVYVAAPLARYQAVRDMARRIEMHDGFKVCSTWHEALDGITPIDPRDPEARQQIVSTNLADLTRSNVVLALCASGVT